MPSEELAAADASSEPPPLDGGSSAAVSADDVGAGQFRSDLDEDWNRLSSGIRQRTKTEQRRVREQEDEDAYLDDAADEPRLCGRQCVILCVAFVLSILFVGGYQLWQYYNPRPVSCTLELIRPQKFKLDVTDFFKPRVSAALQLVLSLKNPNMLRSMLLESCKLTTFEAETTLKLGSATHSGLVLKPFTTQSVTVYLKEFVNNVPQEEHRRLAAAFLANKALLLTIVATATSRLPTKGSKTTEVTSNSTKRVDLSSLAKEPFFQRAPPPPPEPEVDADGKPKAHDVPNA